MHFLNEAQSGCLCVTYRPGIECSSQSRSIHTRKMLQHRGASLSEQYIVLFYVMVHKPCWMISRGSYYDYTYMDQASHPNHELRKSLERILCMAWSDLSHCAYCLWVVCCKVCLSWSIVEIAYNKPYASCHVCFNLSRLHSSFFHTNTALWPIVSELNTYSHRLKPPEIRTVCFIIHVSNLYIFVCLHISVTASSFLYALVCLSLCMSVEGIPYMDNEVQQNNSCAYIWYEPERVPH